MSRALAAGLAVLAAACDRPRDPPPAREASASPSMDAAFELGVDAALELGDAGAPEDAGLAPHEAWLGSERAYTGAICSYLLKGTFRIAERDLRTSFVDGDDPLALVNRSPQGALAPDYAPRDLVSFSPRKPRSAKECESLPCLRKDAMEGYDALVAAMKAAGYRASLESAYRSYRSQCGTFAHWAGASSACRASQQSALPGHSQHQLGTVVDLFTEKWRASGPGVFRNGFGCNPAGAFLREQAWKYGWVVSYPIHPDDRLAKRPCEPRFDLPVSINPATGYAHEAWHIRYLGVQHATAFHEAASQEETLTLEQWLRERRGLPKAAATELPVCDGCNCGACSSLEPAASACKDALPVGPTSEPAAPQLLGASSVAEGDHFLNRVRIRVEPNSTTQPPLFRNGKPGYDAGESYLQVASLPGGGRRSFPTLPGAFRIAARRDTAADTEAGARWPYRVALPTAAAAAVYDRANVILPASTGETTLSFTTPEPVAEVALLRGEEPVARLPASSGPRD